MISLILLGLQSTSEIKQQLQVKRSVLDLGKKVSKNNVHTGITWWEGKVVNQDIPCRKWHHLHLSWCVSKSLKSEKKIAVRMNCHWSFEKIKIINFLLSNYVLCKTLTGFILFYPVQISRLSLTFPWPYQVFYDLRFRNSSKDKNSGVHQKACCSRFSLPCPCFVI